MNRPIKITEDTFWVGVNDRETDLFESLWPIPRGISYNAYLIRDKKVALVDTVKKSYLPNLLDKIRELIGNDRQLDYLIINHMEPDHSGAVDVIKQVYPDVEIVGNQKTIEFLKGYYGIADGVKIVEDG